MRELKTAPAAPSRFANGAARVTSVHVTPSLV